MRSSSALSVGETGGQGARKVEENAMNVVKASLIDGQQSHMTKRHFPKHSAYTTVTGYYVNAYHLFKYK